MINKIEDFYCDEVLNGKTPVKAVMETSHVLAFHHTRPFYEEHIVVIPKKHIPSIITVEHDEMDLMMEIFEVIQKVAKDMNREFGACTVSTNIGEYQTNKHMHWHVHYGKRLRD